MPHIKFGSHYVSRLIVGGNSINGFSHAPEPLGREMKEYFTSERILNFLNSCSNMGINTWQSSSSNLELYKKHKSEGGSLQFISLGFNDPKNPDLIHKLVDGGVIAIAHHGEITDHLFRIGRIDEVRKYLKKVSNFGILTGVSTHIPSVVKYIEDENWNIDFYMTCVYERNRPRKEFKAILNRVPIPSWEVYLEEDPPRMFKVMNEITKPCLAFKILAAGRLCYNQDIVEQTFKSTLKNIKSSDAVIVGMYPKYENQIKLNVQYTCKYSKLSF
jgi:hypothetical protein